MRGASHHPVFMGNCPTIGHMFLALSTQWMSFPSRQWRHGVSPRYHLIVLCLVWIKRIRRQGEFTPLVQTSSDRVAFRILSNIIDGALPRKQPTPFTHWLFFQKSPPWTSDLTPNVNLTRGAVNGVGGGGVHCRCMELVAVGWCTRMWLRLYQTIRNLSSGDLGIPLVVIRLGVTRLKKPRVVCLSDLFEGRGEKGQCDLLCVECLSVIGLMVLMLMCY